MNAHPITSPCSVSSSQTSAHRKLIISPAEPQCIPLPTQVRQEQGYPTEVCVWYHQVFARLRNCIFLPYCAAVRAGPSWLPSRAYASFSPSSAQLSSRHWHPGFFPAISSRSIVVEVHDRSSLQVLYGRERASISQDRTLSRALLCSWDSGSLVSSHLQNPSRYRGTRRSRICQRKIPLTRSWTSLVSILRASLGESV